MFLPKSKYTIKSASYGMFKLENSANGSYYVGPYIEDYLGRTFAGTDIRRAEERVLISVQDEEAKPYKQIQNNLVPDSEAYLSGSYIRYFRQNKISRVVEEISKDRTSEEGPYKVVSGSWILTGSLDDQLIYGKPYRGVRYRNDQTLQKWEKEIRGLRSALNLSPEDFVQEIQ